MKEYTEVELQENYDKFLDYVKKHFTGDRLEKLLKLYSEEDFGLRLLLAPASATDYFHNAWCGGYIDHVLNVCKASVGVKKLYAVMGGTIDFTDEELAFACLHHDLGKLGDEKGHEYYLPQDSEWHRKNKGEIFKFNPKLQYMDVTDRTFFILQHYGITVTEKEYLGLLCADGPYSEGNRKYFITYNKDNVLKTNLPYIVHYSDFLACRTEYDQWRRQQ